MATWGQIKGARESNPKEPHAEMSNFTAETNIVTVWSE